MYAIRSYYEQPGAADRLEDLGRSFLAQLLQAFLQLLGLERVAQARGAEHLRREVGDALEMQGLALGEVA